MYMYEFLTISPLSRSDFLFLCQCACADPSFSPCLYKQPRDAWSAQLLSGLCGGSISAFQYPFIFLAARQPCELIIYYQFTLQKPEPSAYSFSTQLENSFLTPEISNPKPFAFIYSIPADIPFSYPRLPTRSVSPHLQFTAGRDPLCLSPEIANSRISFSTSVHQ